MRLRSSLTLLGLAALGCAAEAKPDGITLQLSSAGDVCSVLVGGKSFTSATDRWNEAAASEVQRVIRDKKATIHLKGGMDVPDRCVGGLISELQRAGYSSIGFAADPPPTSFDIRQ